MADCIVNHREKIHGDRILLPGPALGALFSAEEL